SRILGMTYKNTCRKFLWLGSLCQSSTQILQARDLYLDEMETIEHTKCKPLSIALMVNENYQILAAKVARMPAKGRLAQFSVQKYGYRTDERPQALKELFSEVKSNLSLHPGKVLSDDKSAYRKFVESYFPQSQYQTYVSSRKEKHRSHL